MRSAKPLLMGILNVTPDSFSDGGLFYATQDAIAAGRRMAAEGADIIDVGGESTRPGAAPVAEQDELARVLPVVAALASEGIRVSIDTSKPGVALRALAEGAQIVNDITGMRNPEMVSVCAAADCPVCLMHMQGEPRTMQLDPAYNDVVTEVRDYLLDRAMAVQLAGVRQDRIWIDPGIGFGKTVEHNLRLLRELRVLVETGYPVLIGVSRKSFIGKVLDVGLNDRLEGTIAAQVLAQASGAAIIRAHDVIAARRAIDVTSAVLSA